MAYTITTTAGTTLAEIADGTVNSTSTSLTLIGKNYAGYGIFLNENFVKLLENFRNSSAPTAPLTGQLWYDSGTSLLKVYNGSQWKPISSSSASNTSPTNPTVGDLWFDTNPAINQLKVWAGSDWITIGPSYSAASGQSGAIVEQVLDASSVTHTVVKFTISSQVVAILSKDATPWTPVPGIAGFSTIKPGLNLVSSSTISGSQLTGDASNALSLQGVSATSFLRSDIPTSTPYAFSAASLTVGGNLSLSTSGAGQATIANGANNQNIILQISKATVPTAAVTISGSTGQITINDNLVVSGGVAGINVRATTESTSWTDGAAVIAGGLGVAKNIRTAGGVWSANLNVVGSGIAPAASVTGNLLVTGQNSIVQDQVSVATRSNVFAVVNGTQNSITFNSRWTGATGNPAVTANDSGILFNNLTGTYMVIAPWGSPLYSTGLRISASTGDVNIPNTQPSTTTTTGALTVGGGVGIVGNLNAGSNSTPGSQHILYGNLTVYGNVQLGNLTFNPQSFIRGLASISTNNLIIGTLNAVTIGNTGATLTGDTVNAGAINAVTFGNTGSTAGFNTVNAGAVRGVTIGNTGATLNGDTVNAGAVRAVSFGNTGSTAGFNTVSAGAINAVTFGNTGSTAGFNTVSAGAVNAVTIGNTGATGTFASITASTAPASTDNTTSVPNTSWVRSYGGFQNQAQFTSGSAASWVVPTGINKVKVTVVGGGGAGGSATAIGAAGGGGGAGGIASYYFTGVAGLTFTYTVGTGGVAGGSAATNSTASVTISATTYTITGGAGGAATAGAASTSVVGGTGGTASGTNTTAGQLVAITGSAGNPGSGTASATSACAGAGASGFMGAGAGPARAGSAGAGTAGAAGTGAGGGGATANGSLLAGGTGGTGIVIFEY